MSKNNQTVSSYEEFSNFFKEVEEGYVIALPSSGLKVRMTVPSITDMALNGQLPSELVAEAMRIQSSGGTPSIEDMKKFMEFLNLFFCKAVIEPKFSANPDSSKQELDVNKVDENDKTFVLNVVQKGVATLKTFRVK